MAIIEHPTSRLKGNERDDAKQELIGALQGDTNYTGTYFYPIFDDADDYGGPDDYDDDPYSYMGNYGPDMFSR